MAMNHVEPNSSGSDEDTQRIRAEEFARKNKIQPSTSEDHYSPRCRYERVKGELNGRQVVWHYRICECSSSQFPDQSSLKGKSPELEEGLDFHLRPTCRWKRTGSGKIMQFCFCRETFVPQQPHDLIMVEPSY